MSNNRGRTERQQKKTYMCICIKIAIRIENNHRHMTRKEKFTGALDPYERQGKRPMYKVLLFIEKIPICDALRYIRQILQLVMGITRIYQSTTTVSGINLILFLISYVHTYSVSRLKYRFRLVPPTWPVYLQYECAKVFT